MHAYELDIENIKLPEVFHGNSENISVFVFSWLIKNPSIRWSHVSQQMDVLKC